MKLLRCENGHFYDSDKFSSCPHCSSVKARSTGESSKTLHSDVVKESSRETSTLSEKMATTTSNNADNFGTRSIFSSWKHKKEEQNFPKEPVSQNEGGVAECDVKNDDIIEEVQNSISVSAPHDSQSVSVSMPSPAQPSLRSAVEEAQADMDDIKTVGYFGNATGTEPVVGWLVAIEGPAKGISYELIAGKNSIGRSSTMTVVIVQDNKVSRDKHTTVMYEPGGRKFYLLAGESNGMVYYNGDILLENKVLAKGDRIKVGDSVLLFVPLCGEDFSWEE